MNAHQPWQLLLVTLAGWINRQQQVVIAYIQVENRVLKNKLKGKRIAECLAALWRPHPGLPVKDAVLHAEQSRRG